MAATKRSKLEVKDKWPKEWKRPFYGPEVIAKELIRAGKNLLKQQRRKEASDGVQR